MNMVVERYAGPPEEWDAFVRGQAGWTHYHLYGWSTVFRRALGHRSEYLAARDEHGMLRGVLPLTHVRSVLFGRYLMSVPFLNYGGPLGSADAIAALTAHAVKIAQERKTKLLELRSRGPLPVDLPVSHRKITVVLDLPDGSLDSLWNGFDGNVRRRVRRSMKEGVQVRFGTDLLPDFYRVFQEHMRDLGTPTHGYRLFSEVIEVFPEAWVGVAYLGNEPIAAIIGFVWDREFEVTWASALIRHKQIAANMHLYWAFMERCAEHGIRIFNFGRCTPEGGTHRFKSQWGSRDEQLWWYQHRAKGLADAGTPSPDGKYAKAVEAWKKIPLPIANVIGPRIVRGIP